MHPAWNLRIPELVKLLVSMRSLNGCVQCILYSVRVFRLYSRLDSRYEHVVRQVETSLLRYLIVAAIKAGRTDKVLAP